MRLRQIAKTLRDSWLELYDPRRLDELRGERVVFRFLQASGFLTSLEGKRVLEIGPKHGEDSACLASLTPSELVLLDLAEKSDLVHTWLPAIACPTRYVEGNLLYLAADALRALGTFDLVWCCGVLYHNVEQLRLIRKLFQLTHPGGRVVIESATTRNRHLQGRNVVELHWPRPYRELPTITHLPSRNAIRSWMEMVGFGEVVDRPVYSRKLASHRAVLTGTRPEQARPYVGYGELGSSPDYVAGDAT